MKDIFKQAMKLQERMREELQKIRVEGSAGGGMVKVEMDGEQNVLSVKIEPQIIEDKDINMLQDLIIAAFNDAQNKVKEKAQESLASITGLPFFNK
ncbi:MAG: YbaB/EbfC family nucleoid-associated protein [candidate division WOR-3 bacterium]